MQKIITAIVVLALATSSLPSAASAPMQAEAGPFTPVAQANWQVTRLAAQRGRLVTVDFDYLGRNPTWQLNLFDDVTLQAIIERSEPTTTGGTIWYGRVANADYSSVTAVAENGILAANISLLSGHYMVEYVSPGIHAIYQIDDSAFPPEGQPVVVDIPEAAPATAGTETTTPTDDGSLIDVLVAYTPNARTAVGGTSAMQTLINLAIAETNQGYQNSQVTQRLRLVHAYETTYTEVDFSTDLTRIQGTGDGFMDEVHGLRNTYAADEVVLLINNASSCGLAYLMTTVSNAFAVNAFAVAHYDCATGYYSFGHELGHNMGSEHDRANAFSPQGAYSYSYGYQNPSNLFRTVMAYNCPSSCPRVLYFSNPDVSYNGQPTGIIYTAGNSADNRRSLNNTAYTVANFRASAVNLSYKVYIPLAQRLVAPASSIANGDFESGRTVWTETSSNSYILIGTNGTTPHGGSWLAWLAGANNETSTIAQAVTVPASNAYLYFWHQTGSSDGAGNDFGDVSINNTSVYSRDLAAATGGWVKQVVDLNTYAGQTVTLRFQATTNSTLTSSWFIDDVGWQTTP